MSAYLDRPLRTVAQARRDIAEALGWNAALAGEAFSSNPYTAVSIPHISLMNLSWDEGWADADHFLKTGEMK